MESRQAGYIWKLIYEDKDLLVVYKSAGLPVQSASIGTKDLESLLKTYLRENSEGKKTAGSPQPYLGIVHRLDQPVEGLVVFAKNQKAAAELSAQAADGRMEKVYLAGVYPEAREAQDAQETQDAREIRETQDAQETRREGTLTDWLLRDGRTNMSRVVPAGTKGAKKAVLSYEFVREDIVRIRLQTGRHHQIRVQMAHAGWPLKGDRKYGHHADGTADQAYRFPALCACELSFLHPADGRRMHFALPEEEVIVRL